MPVQIQVDRKQDKGQNKSTAQQTKFDGRETQKPDVGEDKAQNRKQPCQGIIK